MFVEATASKQEIKIVIRDQGIGFDTSKVPEKVHADLFAAESGKGLVLMKSFADELSFNEKGNEITMIKKCC